MIFDIFEILTTLNQLFYIRFIRFTMVKNTQFRFYGPHLTKKGSPFQNRTSEPYYPVQHI